MATAVAVVGMAVVSAGGTARADDVFHPWTCPAPTITRIGTVDPTVDQIEGSGGTPIGGVVPSAVTHPWIDMDGNGVHDTVSVDGQYANTITIVRSDGTVTVSGIPNPDQAIAHGADLDGDGGDDIWGTSEPLFDDVLTMPETWVLPSHLPPGTYDYESLLNFDGRIVGDVTGDGRNDAQLEGPSSYPIKDPPYPWKQPVRFASLVGELDSAPGSHGTLADAPTIGDRADVDSDGTADTLILNPTGGTDAAAIPQVHFSGSGLTLPVGGTEHPTAAVFVREGSRTYVRGNVGNGVVTYRINASCANPWFAQMGDWVRLDLSSSSVAPTDDPTDAQRLALVTQQTRSTAGRQGEINGEYHRVLGRFADPGGLTHWTNVIMSGHRTLDNLTASLVGSNEKLSKYGYSIEDWVKGLYTTYLGRNADPSGLAHWMAKVSTSGAGRVASMFLATPGVRTVAVRRAYASKYTVDRSPTSAELAAGVALLMHGGTEAFRIQLAASPEVYVHAQQRAWFTDLQGA